MVSAPSEKLPVVTEYACMARVKPQGKKNVITPMKNGAKCFGVYPKNDTSHEKNFGRVIDVCESRGEISTHFIPRNNSIIPAPRVISPNTRDENEMNDQNIHRSPPNKPNPIIRPIQKYTCGSNLFHRDTVIFC